MADIRMPGPTPPSRDLTLEICAIVAYRTSGILGGKIGPTVEAAIVSAAP